MKIKYLLSLVLTLTLVSCGSNTQSNEKVDGTEEKASAIVVYCSATNHTENVAKYISNHINSNIYELEPVDPYTSEDLNYNNSESRVCVEYNSENVVVELKETSFDGFESATHVFIGAPV